MDLSFYIGLRIREQTSTTLLIEPFFVELSLTPRHLERDVILTSAVSYVHAHYFAFTKCLKSTSRIQTIWIRFKRRFGRRLIRIQAV